MKSIADELQEVLRQHRERMAQEPALSPAETQWEDDGGPPPPEPTAPPTQPST